MAHALVALGSNVGNSRRTLDDACRDLAATPGVKVVCTSRWYETSPVGGPGGQDVFLNGAVLLETSLNRRHCSTYSKPSKSNTAAYVRLRGSCKMLDLDLLLYDDIVLQSIRLTLPHPRLSYRKFVLEGAVEIAGAMYRHPCCGRTLDELRRHLETSLRYVAFVGHSAGFRMQFAEAADAAGALLVEATVDDVLPFETLSSVDGLTTSQVIQFVAARTAAVGAFGNRR